MPPAEKRCCRCRLMLPAAAFYVVPSRCDGLNPRCRPCGAAHHAERRAMLDYKWKQALRGVRSNSRRREQVDARRAARLASRTPAQERRSARDAERTCDLDYKWKQSLSHVLSHSREREQTDVRRADWDITRAEREAFNREHGKPE